jgi:hypothetical protein
MDFGLILDWILHPIRSYTERQQLRQKIQQLNKTNPFIYK